MSDLAARIYSASHITGEFVLRSGRTASEYFDKYRFEADPALLDEVAAAMAALVPAGTDVLAGLEMGGIAVVTALGWHTGRAPLCWKQPSLMAPGASPRRRRLRSAGARHRGRGDLRQQSPYPPGSCGNWARVDHALCVIGRRRAAQALAAADHPAPAAQPCRSRSRRSGLAVMSRREQGRIAGRKDLTLSSPSHSHNA
jgi:orotate phosphoribosyltransferase